MIKLAFGCYKPSVHHGVMVLISKPNGLNNSVLTLAAADVIGPSWRYLGMRSKCNMLVA